jgi:hypothetical protein
MKFKTLAALAALSLAAGSASAATFSLLDPLAAGQGRTYVFDVDFANGLTAAIQDRYTWYFPMFYPNSTGGWSYLLNSETSIISADCAGGVCSPPGSYPTPDSYVSILATKDQHHVTVVAENRTQNTSVSNCDNLTSFSICAVQFDPAKVGVSFNYGGPLPSYTVSSYAVPEPATWAMMIAGFGLMGGALRRRRAQAVAA